MASLEVNTREDCDEVFAAKNLEKFGINPRILRRQIPKGFIDVISCIGNNFDTAQSKFMNIDFMILTFRAPRAPHCQPLGLYMSSIICFGQIFPLPLYIIYIDNFEHFT